jgi:hypothetical protein
MKKKLEGQSNSLIKTHPHPVWREKANFILMADVEHEGIHPIKEQLWARQISENRFEICCIPFFIYDLALGDEVETGGDQEKRYLLQHIVRRSGNQTRWIWFNDSANDEVRLRVRDKVAGFGCLMEWCYYGLLAFNVTAGVQPESIEDALKDELLQGYLEFTSIQTS